MGKEKLAHFATVACPDEECGSLQIIPLKQNGGNYTAAEKHKCSCCGKTFRITCKIYLFRFPHDN